MITDGTSLQQQSPNGESSLLELIRNYSRRSGAFEEEEPPIRFRPPYLQTPKHDARGDAVALIVDHLSQRNFPQWAAYAVAYSLVDAFMKDLQTEDIPFVEGEYDPIDASVWCRDVIEHIGLHIKNLAAASPSSSAKPPNFGLLPFSLCAQKNRRSKMEDRTIILPTLSVVEPSKSFKAADDALFAVFDGHNGADCANYASTHFARCLLDNPTYATDDMEKVMRDAFISIDKRLTARCRHENIKGGTTAVCALIRHGKQLCVAWCGDSAAAVLREDSVRTLSSAHSPDVPEEVRRIEEAGGIVVPIQGELRVNGILNLTRSLGDVDGRPMISPEPDVISFELDGTEYLLMLATDGVWDSLSEAEVHSLVADFVRSNQPECYKKLSEYIVTRAKEAGATDNLTLICVFLKPVADLWKLFDTSN